MIADRLVFLFPGFEPMRADAHIRRFVRGAESAAALWGCSLEHAPATPILDDPLFPVLDTALAGTGFRTRTRIVFCDWGDLILAYRARPAALRFAAGLVALADFLISGTVFRYYRVSWRYGFFYLFPIVVTAAAAAIGWLAGSLAAAWIAGAFGVAAGALLGLALFAGLLLLADRRMHLLTAMDDWAMARDICRGRNPAIGQRVERQAAAIAAAMRAHPADETVLAAHSLGASMAVPALAAALAGGLVLDRRFQIVTVGSSLMKTALHPAAKAQRQAVASLVARHELPWTDCQGLSDPINFYKSNPATSLKIRDGRTPKVVRVHFKHMVKPETYRRIKRDFFRLHRQFVLPVERRCPYSFHMLLMGPNPVGDFAETRSVDVPPLTAAKHPPAGMAAPERAAESGPSKERRMTEGDER
ncbi:hypothetical protein [Jiella sp. M17.18]|uniref:hypothetical protein n=1 Tax=Jiella sp. M17.18 TaxID=3234247 RepID=UPI0034DF9152